MELADTQWKLELPAGFDLPEPMDDLIIAEFARSHLGRSSAPCSDAMIRPPRRAKRKCPWPSFRGEPPSRFLQVGGPNLLGNSDVENSLSYLVHRTTHGVIDGLSTKIHRCNSRLTKFLWWLERWTSSRQQSSNRRRLITFDAAHPATNHSAYIGYRIS